MTEVKSDFTLGGNLAAFDAASFRELMLLQFPGAHTLTLSAVPGSVIATLRMLFVGSGAGARAAANKIAMTPIALIEAAWFNGTVSVLSVSSPTLGITLVPAPSPPPAIPLPSPPPPCPPPSVPLPPSTPPPLWPDLSGGRCKPRVFKPCVRTECRSEHRLVLSFSTHPRTHAPKHAGTRTHARATSH